MTKEFHNPNDPIVSPAGMPNRQRGGAGGVQSSPSPGKLPAPIYLPFPPSVNRIWRAVNGGAIKSAPYRTWQADAGVQLMTQRPKKHEGPVAIEMLFTLPDRRLRDIDNLAKAPLDLLVAHGVIQSDDWRFVRKLTTQVSQRTDQVVGVDIIITPWGE